MVYIKIAYYLNSILQLKLDIFGIDDGLQNQLF